MCELNYTEDMQNMADEKQDQQEQTEEKAPLNVFITEAESGLGLALTRLLTQSGANVVGATGAGTSGAVAIRRAGGVPVYPDLDRVSAVASAISMAKAQVVVHLSAQVANNVPQASVDYAAAAKRIPTVTGAVATAAGQTGVKRFIHISSAAIYGDHGGESVDESTAVSHANALYDALAEAEAAVLDGGLKSYVLRAGIQYGGENQALRELGDHLVSGGSIVGGSGLAGFIHEEDLAEAINAIIQLPLDGDDEATATVYNVVGDTPATPDEFVNALGEELGIGLPTRSQGSILDMLFGREASIQGDLLNHSANPSNAAIKAALDWTPNYPHFSDGLDRTLLFWRASAAPDEPETDETDDKALAVT